MKKLDPPIKRYLMGARPSHSPLKKLEENYKDLPKGFIMGVLKDKGYLSEEGKTTELALNEELAEVCEKKILWNLDKITQMLSEGGLHPERKAVNQEVELPANGEPVWANLGTIGTYFSVSANTIGKWLDEAGLREDNDPTPEATDGGYVTTVEMNAGGKKTRTIHHWNLHLTKLRLVEEGHELNFNYEDSLKGKGKNGDVQVANDLDAKVKEFAIEFAKLYKNPATRRQTKKLVDQTPIFIRNKAEVLLKRPGLFTKNEYLRNM